ncbi:hypothetical protein EDD91_4369 [Streptomyces sp. KS 21]|nr:hypothetical protein EDD91_4369 [Streptomyces sp. KS 21]
MPTDCREAPEGWPGGSCSDEGPSEMPSRSPCPSAPHSPGPPRWSGMWPGGGHSPPKGPKEALSGPGQGQPAPDSDQMTTPAGMGPQAPQIATRSSSLGVRRPSGAGHKPPRRLRGRIFERLQPVGGEKRARRSLMADFSTSHSDKRPFTSQPAAKTGQTTRRRFPGRPAPVMGGLCPTPDGRRTPNRAERVAIWGVHGRPAPQRHLITVWCRLTLPGSGKGFLWALQRTAASPWPPPAPPRWSRGMGCGWKGAAGRHL